MKKIINYIAAVGMIMSAVSCSFTDLEPTDKVGIKKYSALLLLGTGFDRNLLLNVHENYYQCQCCFIG